ncbi:Short-chain dehydrogenase/reductase family protein [Mycena indigotica]|uniref:Short-chain dehydrogenase/reductase family protein n=1 Tax=Mycena indigotica TaxID=2126181 RepID=A0A8H6VSH8_9AGAR|nr:Short-chain dehydrogenase/reductase family protein [Mycena indigotica]KAF7292229.1 Short-chain dehydrogenase/reductase family protein [Mycena indigotica]
MAALPPFSAATTAEEAADALAESIRGKNVIVTGTSLNGIGFETARVIAKHARLVVITGHSDERLNLAAEGIRKSVPSANIRTLNVDLASLAAVRKAAAEVNAYTEPIHVLINNAAKPWCDFSLSADGIESQLATGHVGPFLLTHLLVPKLLASASAEHTPRAIFVSSIAQALEGGKGVDFDMLVKPDEKKYDAPTVYHQVKTANVLTSVELLRRTGGRVKTYSLHPGLIYTNMLVTPLAIPFFQALGALDKDAKPTPTEQLSWKTIAQGAATTVVAAFDPRIADRPGAYLDDCAISENGAAPHSTDPEIARRLWEATEELVGEKFAF